MTIPDAKTLRQKKCLPCEGGVQPMSEEKTKDYLKVLEGWELGANRISIHKTYIMKNFLAAVQFINKIAEVAEGEDHHPDIHLTGYRKLTIELSTHAIKGLSENDFILASKIDALPKDLKQKSPA